ncbi:MAG: aminoacyl-tRNA hydrolase [Clostridia bacterium]|nr:aminoacyl-tRNA hydrolase [Clostridia bacterium]
MFLIAALGNPGLEYKNTRHNAGFAVADKIADDMITNFRKDKNLFCDLCKFDVANERCILIKPQTFMNNSGKSVKSVMDYYGIDISNLIVLCDDINLDPGQIRIRRNGSAGGHNGLKSIIEYLNSDDFKRIKIGVGDRENKNYDLANFVLSTFSNEELKKMEESAEKISTSIPLIVKGDIEEAMNRYNS